MPEAGSRQKLGTTKRLDEVAATTELATSSVVMPLARTQVFTGRVNS